MNYSIDTTLKLATLFWADVRFVFCNSARPSRASPPIKPAPSHRTNGLQSATATFQRTFSSRRYSAPSHTRNSLIGHEWTSHCRWLVSQKRTLYDRSWEEEALQDAISSRSQRQGFPVPLKECGVSTHDESLRAASPLRSSAPGYLAPRFDWRRRAMSRAPSLGHGHKFSRDGKDAHTHIKRLVPQQLEIQPGDRFYHEVKAYEDRCVLSFSYLRSL